MNGRMRLSIFLTVLATLMLVMAACAGAPAAPAADSGDGEAAMEPIKVGAIFDLTGPTSDVGTGYAQGIQDYFKYINDQGGLEGHPLELISQDYGYKVDVAEQLYSQYVDEGVVAFQGWGTGDTEALRTRIAADEIPFMSASYSAALNNQEEAPYNFLAGTTYSDQMLISLRWALDDWAEKGGEGAPKIAVLHHSSPFGASPVADGEAFAAENGMEFTAIPMPSGATDLTPELTQVQSFGADYIVIQNVPSPAALLLKDKQRLGMDDVQVICLNWCANEILVNLSEGAAEGVVGAMPYTPLSVEVPGQEPIFSWAEANGVDLNDYGSQYTQGWTTMALMSEGIRRVIENGDEVTGANIKAALETLDNFDTGGMSAPVTFTPEDHRSNRALRLFQVEGDGWTALTDEISAE